MSQSLSSATFALLTLLLIFLFNLTFSQSVQAQSFRPIPDSRRCSGFTEGQGLYIVGGHGTEANFTAQTFMLDLSVSWNTSDPVFRKIPGGPMMTGMTCTMTNNGEDLFVLSRGTGYIYNVKSDPWSVFQNNKFPVDPDSLIATDPATGFMYIPEYGEDFSGTQVVLAVDTRTRTVNNIQIPRMDVDNFYVAAWSAHLKSMLIFPRVNNPPYTFTPSETRKPTKGWGQMAVPDPKEIVLWDCVASAYNGSKMVLLGKTMMTPEKGVIYILDVVKQTWKGAPATGLLGIGACAVTCDQFIIWGGENEDDTQIKQSNATRVFHLKTEKWVTSYIAPPRPTTTATLTSSTSQLSPTATPTEYTPNTATNPDPSDKLVNIIIIVVGALLGVILTVISVYYVISRRMKSGIQTT